MTVAGSVSTPARRTRSASRVVFRTTRRPGARPVARGPRAAGV